MKGVHVDLGPQIVAHARACGRDISGDEIVALNESLNALQDLDPDMLRLAFALGAGRFGSLGQALDILAPQHRRLAA